MQIQKITVLTLAHYLITDETKDSDVTELTKITLPVIKMSCSLVAAEGSIISRDFLRRNGGKIHRPRRTFFLTKLFSQLKKASQKSRSIEKIVPGEKEKLYLCLVSIFTALFILVQRQIPTPAPRDCRPPCLPSHICAKSCIKFPSLLVRFPEGI